MLGCSRKVPWMGNKDIKDANNDGKVSYLHESYIIVWYNLNHLIQFWWQRGYLWSNYLKFVSYLGFEITVGDEM